MLVSGMLGRAGGADAGRRLDWEAVMAYVLLPPAGGVLLLITEHKSDYVRWGLYILGWRGDGG